MGRQAHPAPATGGTVVTSGPHWNPPGHEQEPSTPHRAPGLTGGPASTGCRPRLERDQLSMPARGHRELSGTCGQPVRNDRASRCEESKGVRGSVAGRPDYLCQTGHSVCRPPGHTSPHLPASVLGPIPGNLPGQGDACSRYRHRPALGDRKPSCDTRPGQDARACRLVLGECPPWMTSGPGGCVRTRVVTGCALGAGTCLAGRTAACWPRSSSCPRTRVPALAVRPPASGVSGPGLSCVPSTYRPSRARTQR